MFGRRHTRWGMATTTFRFEDAPHAPPLDPRAPPPAHSHLQGHANNLGKVVLRAFSDIVPEIKPASGDEHIADGGRFTFEAQGCVWEQSCCNTMGQQQQANDTSHRATAMLLSKDPPCRHPVGEHEGSPHEAHILCGHWPRLQLLQQADGILLHPPHIIALFQGVAPAGRPGEGPAAAAGRGSWWQVGTPPPLHAAAAGMARHSRQRYGSNSRAGGPAHLARKAPVPLDSRPASSSPPPFCCCCAAAVATTSGSMLPRRSLSAVGASTLIASYSTAADSLTVLSNGDSGRGGCLAAPPPAAAAMGGLPGCPAPVSKSPWPLSLLLLLSLRGGSDRLPLPCASPGPVAAAGGSPWGAKGDAGWLPL